MLQLSRAKPGNPASCIIYAGAVCAYVYVGPTYVHANVGEGPYIGHGPILSHPQ